MAQALAEEGAHVDFDARPKGFTFEEIQARRGGPKRSVSLILPRPKAGEPSGVAILRTIKGYENFNEMTEVLEMLKGGFGLIDAPQLFTNKDDEVFFANGAKLMLRTEDLPEDRFKP